MAREAEEIGKEPHVALRVVLDAEGLAGGDGSRGERRAEEGIVVGVLLG